MTPPDAKVTALASVASAMGPRRRTGSRVGNVVLRLRPIRKRQLADCRALLAVLGEPYRTDDVIGVSVGRLRESLLERCRRAGIDPAPIIAAARAGVRRGERDDGERYAGPLRPMSDLDDA